MKLKKTNISVVAPLLLLAFFAVSVVLVLLTGATLYRNQVEKNSIAYDRRTVSQYISMRVRQSDLKDAYFIGDFYGTEEQATGNTFFALEEHKGILYSTRIYCHDGYLYELFSIHGAEFQPQDGEALFAIQDLQYTRDGNSLLVDITYADNTNQTLVLLLRSGREE